MRRERLLSALVPQFRGDAQAYSLLEEFLNNETYNKTLCADLIDVARGKTGASWELRRLAILMLENQILKIPTRNLTDFDFILTTLNLKHQSGTNIALSSSLLKEGYTTTNLRKFIPEFRHKLERLAHLHAKIEGWRTSEESLRDFLKFSRHDCKLALGRYLFTAAEVTQKILSQLRITDGARDLDQVEGSLIAGESTRAVERLPDFEASILKQLYSSGRIYWVSDAIGSEINSLVEYPLSTVVVTIKPPGSDIEFEIKRAGRKGNRPLDVVFARNGHHVSPSHRLDGGDMQWLLRHEARAAAKFSAVYRLVHDTEPPLPSYVARATIYSIPVNNHEVQTLMYFTDPNVFGKEFGRMRQAMAESVAAFRADGYGHLHELPGDLGLTAQFISIVSPSQGIISGTSTFRLDKLALYLSDNGPRRYFGSENYSKDDARRFADALLEEILGRYTPPDVAYENQQQYVAAALSVRKNRSRADAIYSSLLQEIGILWGTLIGVRGYSRGESFVARNVGLKSVWEDGEWKVKIIFMDHDALGIVEPHCRDFEPHDALFGLQLDETYLWGRVSVLGTVGHLRRIYQISDSLYEEGQQSARKEAKKAYEKTVRKLTTDPALRSLFHEDFITRLNQWDDLVRVFLQAKADGGVNDDWKARMKKGFDKKSQGWFTSHIEAMEKYAALLERQSFLFSRATARQNSR
ncbi:MAG TPA: hypothetical protein VFS90_21165 [Pyrinomonadaceae bacterium]|nr:hypothetical protein [Pyrinomonadaceae bacterium]